MTILASPLNVSDIKGSTRFALEKEPRKEVQPTPATHDWALAEAHAEAALRTPGRDCLCDSSSGWKERTRFAILSFRLQKPYLIYCCLCLSAILFLLTWDIVKGIRNQWNLPRWEHHRWEEAIEATVGVCMVLETLITMRLRGFREFVRNLWCVVDLVVMLLFIISTAYALEHIRQEESITEANTALLLVRFALQPARSFSVLSSTYRTWQMQKVDEMQVDFDLLSDANRRSAFGSHPHGLRFRASSDRCDAAV